MPAPPVGHRPPRSAVAASTAQAGKVHFQKYGLEGGAQRAFCESQDGGHDQAMQDQGKQHSGDIGTPQRPWATSPVGGKTACKVTSWAIRDRRPHCGQADLAFALGLRRRPREGLSQGERGFLAHVGTTLSGGHGHLVGQTQGAHEERDGRTVAGLSPAQWGNQVARGDARREAVATR